MWVCQLLQRVVLVLLALDVFSSLAGFSSKRDSRSGDRRSMTTLGPFLPLSALEVDAEGDRVAVVVFDMMEVDNVMNS